MQNKEQAEDEELLEKFQDDKNSNQNSEIDQIDVEIEGADGEKNMRNITQVEGYDQDEEFENESEISRDSHMHVSDIYS